ESELIPTPSQTTGPSRWPNLPVSSVDLTQALIAWPDWVAAWNPPDSPPRPILPWSLLP
ncbi:MAG: hypothetical protein HZA46_10640, partial [Planctomycetales bacterium]|nr:hypothetical protein [Planctomycetales bacterium]